MIPASHHGSWAGTNRLWFTDPTIPLTSEGTLELAGAGLTYTWVYDGAVQRGAIQLFGPAGACRAAWTDTWHARDGMVLNGLLVGGVLRLYCTYPAGEGPEWGWRIEVDVRDPQAVELRMFNLPPDPATGPESYAVHLRGTR